MPSKIPMIGDIIMVESYDGRESEDCKVMQVKNRNSTRPILWVSPDGTQNSSYRMRKCLNGNWSYFNKIDENDPHEPELKYQKKISILNR